MRILVTGAAGYIASHTLVELLNSGFKCIGLDNLSNSSPESISRIEKITGKKITFIEGDVRDRQLLDDIFSKNDISAVIHFAGLKAVGESVAKPLEYYSNNVMGSTVLCQAMTAAGVYRIVFSSSATVYGEPSEMPITEDFPVGGTTNPYGTSKLMVEQILQDLSLSDPRWSVALLRYFNPIGAHHSGLIGEDPNGIPNNLVPYVSQVAVGKLKELSIFGDDYSTKDGTGVRDYVHVVDLAKGHLAALEYLNEHAGSHVWNLGTGKGYSVKEVVQAFSHGCGADIPCKIVARRPGDIAECWSDPGKAHRELGWKAEKGLDEMMEDTWRWQSKNPGGYKGSEF